MNKNADQQNPRDNNSSAYIEEGVGEPECSHKEDSADQAIDKDAAQALLSNTDKDTAQVVLSETDDATQEILLVADNENAATFNGQQKESMTIKDAHKEWVNEQYEGWPEDIVALLKSTDPFLTSQEENNGQRKPDEKPIRSDSSEVQFQEIQIKQNGLKKRNQNERAGAESIQGNPYAKARGVNKYSENKAKHSFLKHASKDLETVVKQETLDNFFDDNRQSKARSDAKSISKMDKTTMSFFALALAICIVFGVSALFFWSKWSQTKSQIAQFETMKNDFEQLKLDKLAVDEELSILKGGKQPSPNMLNDDGTLSEEGMQAQQAGQTGASTDVLMDDYTVLDGETPWTIAQKVYGNGAAYTKILEANGLTEDTSKSIKPGMLLKIPKQ